MDRGYKEDNILIDGVCYPFSTYTVTLSKKHESGCNLHFHSVIELIYIENGSFNIWLSGKAYSAKAGDLVVINSNECHKIQSSSENCVYKYIKFDPKDLYISDQNMLDMQYVIPFTLNTTDHQRVFKSAEIDTDIIEPLFFDACNEWDNRQHGFELAIRSDILRIILHVIRYWDEIGFKTSVVDISSGLSKTIHPAIKYVEENCATASEAEAAQLCKLSYSYFSHSFKKVMNMRFKEYVNYVRINESQKLLISENKSVSEIAEILGFSSPSHYIQSFKKIKGESPKQFKINYLKNFLNKNP